MCNKLNEFLLKETIVISKFIIINIIKPIYPEYSSILLIRCISQTLVKLNLMIFIHPAQVMLILNRIYYLAKFH